MLYRGVWTPPGSPLPWRKSCDLLNVFKTGDRGWAECIELNDYPLKAASGWPVNMGVLWDRLLCQQGIFNRLEQYQIKVDNLNHFPIFCDIMCRDIM